MLSLPPLDSLIVPVVVRATRITERSLARIRACILLLPVNIDAAAWSRVAHAGCLRALHERKPRHDGDVLTLTVGARAETLIVMAYAGSQSSTFERLQLAQKCARAALDCEPERVLISHLLADDAVATNAVLASIAALQAAAFQLPSFKSKSKSRTRLREIVIARRGKLAGLELSQAGSGGNNLARWLTALPPNELDARGYRRHLQAFARRHRLEYQFYSEAALKRLGAGAFLAVAQGNPQRDAGIARLSYRPRGMKDAICLVGKGICFDTGGTNLKTHKSMLDMHTDMEGSAVALGTLHALIQTQSAFGVDCWLAITENRIGATAYKPQDIVRAVNGTTIQVIHTDAEGRMVLADTLALAARRRPRAIIDYATLTGACVYALTERYSGAFTNRLATRALIEDAGVRSGERVWCFPMDDDFDTDLESSVADVMQCAPDGKGDHILAARFLRRFVPKEIPWLHIDLAAGARRGGLAHVGTDITGFGVRYTLELLRGGWPVASQSRARRS